VKVLFVAGFGPIIKDMETSRQLYGETLDLPLEGDATYLHTGEVESVMHFALWPLSGAVESCFGTTTWSADVPVPGWSLTWRASTRRLRSPRGEGIGCWLSRIGSRGSRSSRASSARKGSWSESRLHRLCAATGADRESRRYSMTRFVVDVSAALHLASTGRRIPGAHHRLAPTSFVPTSSRPCTRPSTRRNPGRRRAGPPRPRRVDADQAPRRRSALPS